MAKILFFACLSAQAGLTKEQNLTLLLPDDDLKIEKNFDIPHLYLYICIYNFQIPISKSK
jgi:hypothetical protein